VRVRYFAQTTYTRGVYEDVENLQPEEDE